MRFRIVTDSSSNVLTLPGQNYASVPLKIRAEKEYVDAPGLDVAAMVEDLKNHKGKSGSSCPNVGEWLEAFGDAEEVFCVTITKNLSGSYNAAFQAAEAYMEENPGRRVFVFDSLSAGPELMLIVEKILECDAAGDDFETTKAKVLDYHNHCHTVFCLESLTNLSRNGRVSPAIAKIAGMLGIRMVGEAKGGQLALAHKPRGARKAIQAMLQVMKERGFQGGYLRVCHCFAKEQAEELKAAVLAEFPTTRFVAEATTALCSFYAEVGGMIVGYEGGYNEENNNQKF